MYSCFDLYKIAHPYVEADGKEHALLVLSNIQNGAMVMRRDELLKKVIIIISLCIQKVF